MRIYEASGYDNRGLGTVRMWSASKRQAQADMQWFLSNGDGRDNGGIYARNIPTTKAALIKWLNLYATEDNG